MPSLIIKLGNWFWRKRLSNVDNVFLLIWYHLPLEKGVALHLNKLEFPSPKDALCQVWLKLAQWFRRRRFLNFCYSVIISPWKRAGPFFWINLNPLHPRMHCATNKFWSEKLTWAFVSGELITVNFDRVCRVVEKCYTVYIPMILFWL